MLFVDPYRKQAYQLDAGTRGGKLRGVILQSAAFPEKIEYDEQEDKIYWFDPTENVISRESMHGTGKELFHVLPSGRRTNPQHVLPSGRRTNPQHVLPSGRRTNPQHVLPSGRRTNPQRVLPSGRRTNPNTFYHQVGAPIPNTFYHQVGAPIPNTFYHQVGAPVPNMQHGKYLLLMWQRCKRSFCEEVSSVPPVVCIVTFVIILQSRQLSVSRGRHRVELSWYNCSDVTISSNT